MPLTRAMRHALGACLSTHPDNTNPDAPRWEGSIESIRPITLRHTFASRYPAANPDDLRGLAALLSHANLDTVMIYTGQGPRI